MTDKIIDLINPSGLNRTCAGKVRIAASLDAEINQ